jgi:hypothetical protein
VNFVRRCPRPVRAAATEGGFGKPTAAATAARPARDREEGKPFALAETAFRSPGRSYAHGKGSACFTFPDLTSLLKTFAVGSELPQYTVTLLLARQTHVSLNHCYLPHNFLPLTIRRQVYVPLRIQLCRWVSVSRRLEGTYCLHLQRMWPKKKNSCAPQLSDTASHPRTPLPEPQISRSLTFRLRRRRLEVETSKIWHCVTHSAGTERLQ